jgi:hypothetical protein
VERREAALRLGWWALGAAALAAGVLTVASTLGFLWESHWMGPVGDFWRFVPMLRAYEQGDSDFFWRLFQPHGGHRLFFPRLLYLAEYRVFRGTNVFLISCSVTIQALTALLLIRRTWRDGGALPRPVLCFLAGFTLVLLFSATQIENFARAWNVHWFLACSAMIWALLALLRTREALMGPGGPGPAAAWLGLCIASAAVSTYSMVDGLLAWPILMLVAWGLRLPWRWSLTLAAAALLIAGPYPLSYQGPDHGTPLRVLGSVFASPLATAQWVAACAGAPLSWIHPRAGTLLGAIGVVAAAAFAIRFALRRASVRPIEAVHVGIVLFSVGSMLMASLGRLQYTRSWAGHRYQAWTLLFWLGLVSLSLLPLAAGPARRRAAGLLLAAGVAVWVGAVIGPAHLLRARQIAKFAATTRDANLALLVGVEHFPSYFRVLPLVDLKLRIDSAAIFTPFLREQRLGVFASDELRYLGLRIGEELTVAATPSCYGKVTDGFLLSDDEETRGVRLRGWAWDRERRSPPRGILVADRVGEVIGLGRAEWSQPGPPSGATAEPEGAAWFAYARPPGQGGIYVWALVGEDAVCQIAGPIKLQRDPP